MQICGKNKNGSCWSKAFLIIPEWNILLLYTLHSMFLSEQCLHGMGHGNTVLRERAIHNAQLWILDYSQACSWSLEIRSRSSRNTPSTTYLRKELHLLKIGL